MCRVALAEKNSRFEVLESLITSNGAIGFGKEKEEEREGRRRRLQFY
jgi:hypothetical protein